MKTFNKKLAELILKNTTTFSLNQVGYSVEKDRLIIWSANGTGAFHSTELITLFAHPFGSFIQYNKTEERCELVIF